MTIKYMLQFFSETAEITDQFSNIVQMRSSISSAEIPTTVTALTNLKNSNKPNRGGVSMSQWNPFEDEDPTPFNLMTEDLIYEAEFDALRDRPSGSLKAFFVSHWRYFINEKTFFQHLEEMTSIHPSETQVMFIQHKNYHHRYHRPHKHRHHLYR